MNTLYVFLAGLASGAITTFIVILAFIGYAYHRYTQRF